MRANFLIKPSISDGVVKKNASCDFSLAYAYYMLCMDPRLKNHYALVIEFFDPLAMDWAIRAFL